MDIPMKYEDVVAQLDAALGRESEMIARANQSKLEMDAAFGTIDLLEKDLSIWKQKACEAAGREAALREELGKANDKIDKAWNQSHALDHQGFIPGALDAWKRPVKQHLPYDFSGNPGINARQYCNGWNDSGGYWSAHAKDLQQRLTVAEQKLGYAYDWGYSDGQNNPNGYSDKEDRDKCVAELLKPAAEGEGS